MRDIGEDQYADWAYDAARDEGLIQRIRLGTSGHQAEQIDCNPGIFYTTILLETSPKLGKEKP